jgi:hypothetical protein
MVEGGGVDAITQASHISAGIQDEYDVSRTVKSTVLGGVIGGGAAGGGRHINDRINAKPAPTITVKSSRGPNNISPELRSDLDGGGSYLMTKDNYKKFAEPALADGRPIGRPDGQFISSSKEMNQIINETGGNSSQLGERLGVNDWGGETLIRMDVEKS